MGTTGRAVAGAVLVTLGLMAPASAGAEIAYVNYDSLVVAAGAGETNALTVQPDPSGLLGAGGPAFLISDPGAIIDPGPGCTSLGVNTVSCSLDQDNPVASLALSLGDKNDVASISGTFFYQQVDAGPGSDRVQLDLSSFSSIFMNPSAYVSLGPGADNLQVSGGSPYQNVSIDGGYGDDTIGTSDAFPETVDCGPGSDTSRPDPEDTLLSCEKVQRTNRLPVL